MQVVCLDDDLDVAEDDVAATAETLIIGGKITLLLLLLMPAPRSSPRSFPLFLPKSDLFPSTERLCFWLRKLLGFFSNVNIVLLNFLMVRIGTVIGGAAAAAAGPLVVANTSSSSPLVVTPANAAATAAACCNLERKKQPI